MTDMAEVERVAAALEGKLTVGDIHAAARGDLGDIRDRAAKLLRSLAKDARRFEWFFNDSDKLPFMSNYMLGIREHWTVDQWRAAIDRAIEAAGRTEGGG